MRCLRPPGGWRCRRAAGHEGPCAATRWNGPPPCDSCWLDWLYVEARSRGLGVRTVPTADSRNPLWSLTRVYLVGPGAEADLKGVVACPAPDRCVCDRFSPPGRQVWGNSSDPVWPHLCPACGYHAAWVADDGVTVVACRAASCGHRLPAASTFDLVAHQAGCGRCEFADRVRELCPEGGAMLAGWLARLRWEGEFFYERPQWGG